MIGQREFAGQAPALQLRSARGMPAEYPFRADSSLARLSPRGHAAHFLAVVPIARSKSLAMLDALRLALRFAFYDVVAFAFVRSVFLLPGWAWWTVGAIFVALIALGLAAGAGNPLAARISRVLSRPHG